MKKASRGKSASAMTVHPSTALPSAPSAPSCAGPPSSSRAQWSGLRVNAHVTKRPARGHSKLVMPMGVARTAMRVLERVEAARCAPLITAMLPYTLDPSTPARRGRGRGRLECGGGAVWGVERAVGGECGGECGGAHGG